MSERRARNRNAPDVSTREHNPPRSANARSVALSVLDAVDRDDAYANIVLPQRIASARLDGRDAALATELCHGTLRWRGLYDAILSQVSSRELTELNPTVRNALRLGVHQVVGMRTDAHAAVNETVELIKAGSAKNAAGFVNAVMRRVTEKTRDEWIDVLTDSHPNPTDRQSILTSHPQWIVRALEKALTADGRESSLEELLQSDNAPGPLGLIDLSPESISLGTVAQLPAECVPARFSPLGFSLSEGGNPARVTTASNGLVRVQDEGSQLATLALIHALPIGQNEEWLDMCAAPGGKSAVLAAYARAHECELTSNELNPARVSLVRSSVKPWHEVQVTSIDGRDFAEHPHSFDRILVDAPCSGLGALRRRPEARWRKTPRDIASLTGTQHDLLDAALVALKPGGVLAYVTCSPHLAETRAIVNKALQEHPDCHELDVSHVLNAITRTPLPRTGSTLSLQLWPDSHGTDAMFISLIKKA